MKVDIAMELVRGAKLKPELKEDQPKTMEVLEALYDEIIRQRRYIDQLQEQLDAQR